MKNIFILSTCFLAVFSCFGQSDTTFFNADWKKCNKTEARFYRTVIKDKDHFIVSDRFINHQPQMIAVCSNSTSPLIKDGHCMYFDDNGTKESQGFFKNNESTGTWTWYDDGGKDSTVATYKADGTKAYSRLSRAQLQKQKTPGNIYQLADEMPVFPGGTEAMNKFIANEFQLPKEDKNNHVSGTFYAVIVVSESGSVSLLEIKKSLSPTLDEEASRVIKKMPSWSAGKIDHKAVKVRMTVPFKIN